MSLLFDALKRAQGNKPDTSQRGDDAKSLQLQNESSPSGHNETSSDAALTKPVVSSWSKNFLPYAATGATLLAAILIWSAWQPNQAPPIEHAKLVIEAASAVIPASQMVVASGVTATDMPAQTSEAVKPASRPWTHPRTPRHHKKPRRKIAKPAMLASANPLMEGYQALSDGNMAQAEQSYLNALSMHPHEKDALLGLAVIAQRRMQMARAADLYHQVLHEDMGNAAAAAGLVSLSEQADPMRAESKLKELIDIDSSSPNLHYTLGCVLARQLRWGEAQQEFFRAYSLAPDKALYAYNLAVSLDRMHQSDAALPYYEKAFRLATPADSTLDMGAIGRRIEELKK
jgi:tetratricopeptide (TPR) repeat protein